MKDKFFAPILDWSDLSDDEIRHIVISSRNQWIELRSTVSDQPQTTPSEEMLMYHLEAITGSMMRYESSLREKSPNGLIIWLKYYDLSSSLANLLHVRSFFLENETPWETYIDVFDIEVAIDVLAKIISIGINRKLPVMDSVKEQFEEAFSNFASESTDTWELYRQEVVES